MFHTSFSYSSTFIPKRIASLFCWKMMLHGLEFSCSNAHHYGRRLLHLYSRHGARVRMNNIEEEPLLPYEKLQKNVSIIQQRSVL